MDLIVTLVHYFDSLTAVTESFVPAVVGFLDLPWVMLTYFLCFSCWFKAISVSFVQNLIFIFQIEENATSFETAFLSRI